MVNGATKDIGKAAIAAVTRARGMEIAGAVDNRYVGEDAGIVLYCIGNFLFWPFVVG